MPVKVQIPIKEHLSHLVVYEFTELVHVHLVFFCLFVQEV